MRISDWSSDVCSSDLSTSTSSVSRGEIAGAGEFVWLMASRIDADQRAVLRGRTPDRIEYLHAGQSVGEGRRLDRRRIGRRSEEHTSELQSLMRISYAVFCLNKKINIGNHTRHISTVRGEGSY